MYARNSKNINVNLQAELENIQIRTITMNSINSKSTSPIHKAPAPQKKPQRPIVVDDEYDSVKQSTKKKVKIVIPSSIFWLIVWLLWLVLGTGFYAYYPNSVLISDGTVPKTLGLMKGFYMAVNIGYSIGWGDMIEDDTYARIFSTIYVIIGASFVAVALGFFADQVVADNDDWFLNAQQLAEYEYNTSKEQPLSTRLIEFIRFHSSKFKMLLLWLLFIGGMVAYSLIEFSDWSIDESLYFAVSSLSTGGHWSLSPTKDWIYAMTGAFAAIGVPLMGIAMASLAGLFSTPSGKY